MFLKFKFESSIENIIILNLVYDKNDLRVTHWVDCFTRTVYKITAKRSFLIVQKFIKLFGR